MVEYIPCFSAPELHWDLLPATRLASRNILIEQNIKKQTGTALCVYNLLGLYSVQCTVYTVYIYWHWQTTQQTLKRLVWGNSNPLVLRSLADISSSNLVVRWHQGEPADTNVPTWRSLYIDLSLTDQPDPWLELNYKEPIRLMFEKKSSLEYIL